MDHLSTLMSPAMGKTAFYTLTVFCVTGAVVVMGLWRFNRSAVSNDLTIIRGTGQVEAAWENHDGKSPGVVYLYFIHKNNVNLSAETREIPPMHDPVARGRFIVENIINGPRSDLHRSVPGKTRLNAFYVTKDKIAYIDLSDDVTNDHPGGAAIEHLTIYSLVNSLILNIPEIDGVKFLINGREALTLAGHVDIRYPFYSNMVLIR